MNGKKARALRRATTRSQGNTRLGRKAASVERSEHEREFDRLMSEARNDRADALKDANASYAKKLQDLDADRKKAVAAIDAAYIKQRDAIVKKCAAMEEKAAA